VFVCLVGGGGGTRPRGVTALPAALTGLSLSVSAATWRREEGGARAPYATLGPMWRCRSSAVALLFLCCSSAVAHHGRHAEEPQCRSPLQLTML
jgi:hypothetical protein